MLYISLEEKTGFRNNAPTVPILIYDFRRKPFYDSKMVGKTVEKFNLPAGNYYVVSGDFSEMSMPVNYKPYKLPPTERRMKSPHNFRITFADNPHKCTIKWRKNEIVFDHKLKELSLPELFFILYHEFGHRKYDSEKAADLYAANMMLKRGYNPSQIGFAPLNSLSEKQYERKKNIVDHVTYNNYDS